MVVRLASVLPNSIRYDRLSSGVRRFKHFASHRTRPAAPRAYVSPGYKSKVFRSWAALCKLSCPPGMGRVGELSNPDCEKCKLSHGTNEYRRHASGNRSVDARPTVDARRTLSGNSGSSSFIRSERDKCHDQEVTKSKRASTFTISGFKSRKCRSDLHPGTCILSPEEEALAFFNRNPLAESQRSSPDLRPV